MKKNLSFVVFNILLCSLILGDTFIFPTKVKKVSIIAFSSKHTSAKNVSYYNYFIHTSDNSRYEIKKTLYDNLTKDDSVTIFSSLILRMPVKIQYLQHEQLYNSKLGQLSNTQAEIIALITSLIISILLLFVLRIKPYKSSGPFFALQAIVIGASILIFLSVISEVFLI